MVGVPSKTTTADSEKAYAGSCLTKNLGERSEIADSAEMAVRTDRILALAFASEASDEYQENARKPIVEMTARTAMATMSSARVNQDSLTRLTTTRKLESEFAEFSSDLPRILMGRM